MTIVDGSKRREFLIRVKSMPPKYFIIEVGSYDDSQDRSIDQVIATKLADALEYKKVMSKKYPDAQEFRMIVVTTNPKGKLLEVNSYREQEAITLSQK